MSKRFDEDYFKGGKTAYKDYENYPRVAINYKITLNLVLKYKKGGKLLELGCATGKFLHEAEKYFETYGIDVSEYAIDVAKKRTKKTTYYINNLNKDWPPGILKNKYNVIVACDIFEHLECPQKTINQCYAMLQQNGILIYRVPNMAFIVYKIMSFIKFKIKWKAFYDPTHISLYSIQKWLKITKEQGFSCDIMPVIPTLFMKRIFLRFNLPIFIKAFRNLNFCMFIICFKNRSIQNC